MPDTVLDTTGNKISPCHYGVYVSVGVKVKILMLLKKNHISHRFNNYLISAHYVQVPDAVTGSWDLGLSASETISSEMCPSVVRGPWVRKMGLPLWCICPHLLVNRSHCVSTTCIPQNTTQRCGIERNPTTLAERHQGSEKQLWYIIIKHQGSESAPKASWLLLCPSPPHPPPQTH